MVSEQLGFHQGHSFTYRVIRLIGSITADGCQGKQKAAFFIDVQKAFDLVWQS